MNGNKLLFDSNIIIYFSKAILDARKITNPEDVPCMSVITFMEVMGYQFGNKKEKNFIEQFCKRAQVVQLEQGIINKVIALRRKNKIKLPDAIIAATAMENKLELVTRNTADFKNIPGLKLFNPFDKN